jgi:hypothetical protein
MPCQHAEFVPTPDPEIRIELHENFANRAVSTRERALPVHHSAVSALSVRSRVVTDDRFHCVSMNSGLVRFSDGRMFLVVVPLARAPVGRRPSVETSRMYELRDRPAAPHYLEGGKLPAAA